MKTKKMILWAIAIIILMLIGMSDLTPGTKTAIFVGIMLFWIISEQEKRHSQKIRTVADYVDNKEKEKPISYKIDVVVNPNWHEILMHFAKELKMSESDVQKEIFKNKKMGIMEEKGLYGKGFRFVNFYNGISNLEQIWSDYHKTFLDDMEIRGGVFGDKDGFFYSFNLHKKIPKKFKNCKLFNPILISPKSIGFDTAGLIGYSEKIQEFPFWEIFRFLKDINKNVGLGCEMNKIKKFSKELEKTFKKYKVKYEDWNYEDYGTGVEPKEKLVESEWATKNKIEICDQTMRAHVFASQFMTIRLRLEFLE
ncbi:hypothetical protein JW758_06140 [Candidatus Peregrinibacteria bacterium]|nr:hypothetical protein [Candidatus Peregrinibacteria bacterium]